MDTAHSLETIRPIAAPDVWARTQRTLLTSVLALQHEVKNGTRRG